MPVVELENEKLMVCREPVKHSIRSQVYSDGNSISQSLCVRIGTSLLCMSVYALWE